MSIIDRDIEFYTGEVERCKREYISSSRDDRSRKLITLHTAIRVYEALKTYKRHLAGDIRQNLLDRYQIETPE